MSAVALLACRILVCTALLPCALAAQEPGPGGATGPVVARWEPARSMGQPPRWRPAVGLAFGLDRAGASFNPGPTLSAALQRDLSNPVTGALGMSVHGYVGHRARELDGGVRLFLDSPAFFLHSGVDWNPRLGRVGPVFSTTFPARRGGWFGRGGLVRLDLLPGRDARVAAGVWVPVNQRFSGKSRSSSIHVRLPEPTGTVQRRTRPVDPVLTGPLEELERSMAWIGAIHNIYWLTERKGISRPERILRSRQILSILRAELDERRSVMPDRATYPREVEHYHRTLERAFDAAAGDGSAGPETPGAWLAAHARRVVLEEVVLPYNSTVGQFREPDTLDGLAALARARFHGWLAAEGPAAEPERVTAVFDAWLRGFERERRKLKGSTGDGRMQWIPLALVLKAEEHDTRDEVDAIIELALGQPFTSGNAAYLTGAARFQEELRRTLREAEEYHVLWIHDFRGRGEDGRPDRTGFVQVTEGYLRSLLESVRAYDGSGRLPIYIIILDQFFYEENDGRLWMDLLERPLTHRVRLPRGYEAMEEAIRSLQDSLRLAVRDSRRLQAEAEVLGTSRIEELVKVHVNIINQSDFSFRTRRLLGLPIGSDNLIRDHRKIVIRDVTSGDPGVGEVILTGAGVGDHYSSVTWDDRAILIQGPAALAARDAAREVLEQNGLKPHEIPPPLRWAPLAPDHAVRVQERETGGATARVIQAHNQTGWGQKDATFIQMLLYDLSPPGTLIYVPDSLWTSPEWMAQLVSAALRGCHVLIVAPTLANAAAPGFPMMSETRDLLVALVLVREALGEMIREAGGDLRVGLYARRASMDDLPARLAEVEAAFAAESFLHEIFSLHPDAWDVISEYRRLPAQQPAAEAPAGGGALHASRTASASEAGEPGRPEPRPKLHQKVQFVGSLSLLEALGRDPGMAEVMAAFLNVEREGAIVSRDSGPVQDRPSFEPVQRMLQLERGLPPPMRDPALSYLMVGSLNKNVRSMALDGEAMAVISGPWALKGYLDFLLLTGAVTWVEAPEDVDALIPPYSSLKRRLGRFLFRVL